MSGATIDGCRIAYRVFGQRDARATNVVLIPTWLGGKSADWIAALGPGQLVDTTRYQVIVVDALANGVSASPSLTTGPFPEVTIEDMVVTQHRLVTEVLGLPHLRGVVGVSMGGIQAFEWAAAHPDFVDRFVSIVGSPRVAPHDRAWLATLVRIIAAGETYKIPADSVFRMFAGVWLLINVQDVVNQRPAGEADSLLAAEAMNFSKAIELADFAAQSRAILAYDFGRRPGADSASIARRLRGRFLVVNSPDDRVISAGPALSFARRFALDSLVIRSSCGHGVFACEAQRIGAVVQSFLAR